MCLARTSDKSVPKSIYEKPANIMSTRRACVRTHTHSHIQIYECALWSESYIEKLKLF